jgi:hypothetical protein
MISPFTGGGIKIPRGRPFWNHSGFTKSIQFSLIDPGGQLFFSGKSQRQRLA